MGQHAVDMANSSNVTSRPLVLFVKEPSNIQVVRLTAEVLIAFCGVVGNGLVCGLTAVKGAAKLRMDVAVRYYILSLAIADLGILLFNFPLAVVKEQVPFRWPLGSFICRYVYPTIEIFFGASVWSIAAIAITRYKIVVRLASTQKGLNQRIAVWSVLGIWGGSFILFAFPLLLVTNYEESTEVCEVVFPAKVNFLGTAYVIMLVIFGYVHPLGVIIWSYVHISQKLEQNSKFHAPGKEGGESNFYMKRRLHENLRTKRLLTPLVITFAITMLPLNVFRLLSIFPLPITWYKWIWVQFNICVIFVISNSSMNPLIYSIVNGNFRRHVKSLVTCR